MRTRKKAIMGLVAAGAIYEALCPEGETFTDASNDTADKYPVLATSFAAATMIHLLAGNKLPDRYKNMDIYHLAGKHILRSRFYKSEEEKMNAINKEKAKNYAAAVPLVAYAGARFLLEEEIPSRLRKLVSRPADEQTQSTVIESSSDFLARKVRERQGSALGQTAIMGEIVEIDFATASEPPTDTYPIAA
jgi:hypothetical protein